MTMRRSCSLKLRALQPNNWDMLVPVKLYIRPLEALDTQAANAPNQAMSCKYLGPSVLARGDSRSLGVYQVIAQLNIIQENTGVDSAV
jgi:hypothetical protein